MRVRRGRCFTGQRWRGIGMGRGEGIPEQIRPTRGSARRRYRFSPRLAFFSESTSSPVQTKHLDGSAMVPPPLKLA
uniref:Uncharacterized protein n=1 Tax=Oryza glumipatula TaxID=40148 RepID=A0A0D9ZR87_9ORYZ